MDGTILSQGSFIATYSGTNPNPGNAEYQAANAVMIQVPSAADWISIRSYVGAGLVGTNAAYFNGTANANTAVEWYWQRGMAPGTCTVKYYANGSAVVTGDAIDAGAVYIYDPTAQQAGSAPLLSNPVAVTAITNATRPVLSTANTAGVSVGSVVRVFGSAQTDVNGIDFVVGAVTANTSITLLTATNPLATAPGIVGGAAGHYQIVNYPPLFYPARKTVVNITAGGQVSTATEHSLTVGQAIRFNIPAIAGAVTMTQLNPTPLNNYLVCTVIAIVDAYNFIIDTNVSSFSAFSWPLYTASPSSYPTYEPIGMNTQVGLAANFNTLPTYQGQPIFNANSGVFADATINTGYYGLILGSGGLAAITGTPIIGPASWVHFSAADAIDSFDIVYWVAGKSDLGGL